MRPPHDLYGMTRSPQQARLIEAAGHFQAAVDADPNDAQLAINLGHILVELNRPNERWHCRCCGRRWR